MHGPEIVTPKRNGVVTTLGLEPAAADWRTELGRAIRDPGELCRVLELPEPWRERAVRAAAQFPLIAPRPLVAKMRAGDPHDPLLRQVLPLGEELQPQAGFTTDPVGDLAARRTPALLHKYHGRALLMVAGACPVHCRYCFRRHFPYHESVSSRQLEEALGAIEGDRSVHEVILSGGEPLMLADDRLRELARRLTAMPHVRRLRIHSRMPVVIPQRVTAGLLAALTTTRLAPVVVLHANHARELGEDVAAAAARLATAGVMLLNQAVLLRGVNDHAHALADLCERLIELRVTPYYLHQLDRVAGAAHFWVDEERARELINQLRRRLPGYAVPRLVREDAGAASKTVLA